MVSRFGESNVFMDVDMAPGVDFVERITEAVAACQVLLVVMGPRWATVEDEQGRARLADPEDFVRLEVETALRRPEVTPIPVLVGGARMPNREDLPQEVRAITRRNALELGDQRWRYDVGRLISTLDELLAESSPAPSQRSPERDGATRQAAPADAAAETARQTAPPSTVAATTPADTKPAAPPPKGAGRFWRWALIGAVAIGAIVVAVVLAVGGDDSPTRAARFTEADLPKLVFPEKAALGNLGFDKDESGAYVEDLQGKDAGFLRVLSEWDGVGYRRAFSDTEGAKPYEYSESTAAVFPDENAAQSALNDLTAHYEDSEDVPAHDLGDDGFAARTVVRSRPEYTYHWRTGNLLQRFYLIWNETPPSEETTRGFVDEMDALKQE